MIRSNLGGGRKYCLYKRSPWCDFFGWCLPYLCKWHFLGVLVLADDAVEVDGIGPRIASRGWILMIVPVIRLPLHILMWRRRWSCLVKEIVQFVHWNCLFQWKAISCRRIFQAVAKLSSQSGQWYLIFLSLGGLSPPSGDFLSILLLKLTTFVGVNQDCALSVSALPLVTEISYKPCVNSIRVRLSFLVLLIAFVAVWELFALVCANRRQVVPVICG